MEDNSIQGIQRRQLFWYGHVDRVVDSRWTKRIIWGTPMERNKWGRPKPHEWRVSQLNVRSGDWIVVLREMILIPIFVSTSYLNLRIISLYSHRSACHICYILWMFVCHKPMMLIFAVTVEFLFQVYWFVLFWRFFTLLHK